MLIQLIQLILSTSRVLRTKFPLVVARSSIRLSRRGVPHIYLLLVQDFILEKVASSFISLFRNSSLSQIIVTVIPFGTFVVVILHILFLPRLCKNCQKKWTSMFLLLNFHLLSLVNLIKIFSSQ